MRHKLLVASLYGKLQWSHSVIVVQQTNNQQLRLVWVGQVALMKHVNRQLLVDATTRQMRKVTLTHVVNAICRFIVRLLHDERTSKRFRCLTANCTSLVIPSGV